MADIFDGEDMDLDWFAVDQQGHVAYLTTAGAAPLPPDWWPALASTQRRILDTLQALPETTTGIALPENLSQNPLNPIRDAVAVIERGGWMEMARRGLYAFDAISIKKPRSYVMLARPGNPIHVSQLGPELEAALAGLVLPWLTFDDVTVVPTEQIYRRQ